LRQYGGIVQRQVNTLARLVNDLLDAARLARGSIELKLEPIDLSTVLEHAVETVRPMFDAKKQTIDVASSAASVIMQGDPFRLEQALVNLLTNASKFSSPQSRVDVTVTVTELEITVCVRDYGDGIDPKLLPSLFGLFVQGNQGLHRPNGGLGIGLSLVKGIVEQHGGAVAGHSAGIGCGSEFTIRLPRAAAVPTVAA
jgi:signal transduction histidine kinase